MPSFTCPNCGGHCFGRDVRLIDGKPVLLTTVRCDSDVSGTPLSATQKEFDAGTLPVRGKPCGWRGEA